LLFELQLFDHIPNELTENIIVGDLMNVLNPFNTRKNIYNSLLEIIFWPIIKRFDDPFLPRDYLTSKVSRYGKRSGETIVRVDRECERIKKCILNLL